MPILWFLLCLALSLGSLALLVYWTVVGWHIARTTRNLPTLRQGLDSRRAGELLAAGPSVCLIIPAHNERDVIVDLARSLAAQDYPNLHVVFALDRCTDDTETLLRSTIGTDPRFEILTILECPQGWAGKVHAIHRGVTDARAPNAADFLLFADADTRLDPGCIRAALALALDRSAGLLSVMSTLTADRWFELVAQPPAGMELLRQYPLERASSDSDRRPFANGQFMLFSRDAYFAVGGHPAVKDDLLEDIALARLCHRHAIRAAVILSGGVLRCRMYASWPEFVRGWKRIYTESANCKLSRLRALALRVRLLGTALPLLALLAVPVGLHIGISDPLAAATSVLGLASLIIMLAILGWSYRLGGTPVWAVLAYPIGAWLVGGILQAAARDLDSGVPTTWAGKTYARTAR